MPFARDIKNGNKLIQSTHSFYAKQFLTITLLVVILGVIVCLLYPSQWKYANFSVISNSVSTNTALYASVAPLPSLMTEHLILNWGKVGKRRNRKLTAYEGRRIFSKCEFNNCRFTTDRGDLDKAEAVLLCMNRSLHGHRCPDMPPYRPNQRQLWIFFQQEPPTTMHTWTMYPCFDNKLNATMTIRKDSDIYVPRIRIEAKRGEERRAGDKDATPNRTRRHKKMAAWFVSKCSTHSKREIYAKELAKYIDIDIYGKCGTLHCPKWDKDCDALLKDQYNFYLSFENSLCRDYVTEKLTRPLLNEVIPVVLGGANYSSILPTGSYIDVKDFESPEALANFMKKVASNDTLYNSYLTWRKTHIIKSEASHVDNCALCKYMNNKKRKEKIYTNLTRWWMQCIKPHDYYRGIDLPKQRKKLFSNLN